MTKASPIMILGILVFVLPVILNIFRITLPKWLYTVGILLIIIGAGHSAYKTIKGE